MIQTVRNVKSRYIFDRNHLVKSMNKITKNQNNPINIATEILSKRNLDKNTPKLKCFRVLCMIVLPPLCLESLKPHNPRFRKYSSSFRSLLLRTEDRFSKDHFLKNKTSRR